MLLAWRMLNKGCYRISIAFSVFMRKSENDSNTLRVDACFFLFESGGYVWTVPKSLNPCCVWIHNGNWIEWSAIWSEIIRVISKSNERAARVHFEITSMISDQNCTTRSSITYCHFEISEFRQYQYIFYWPRSQFVEKRKQKGFYISFCIRNRNDAT